MGREAISSAVMTRSEALASGRGAGARTTTSGMLASGSARARARVRGQARKAARRIMALRAEQRLGSDMQRPAIHGECCFLHRLVQ